MKEEILSVVRLPGTTNLGRTISYRHDEPWAPEIAIELTQADRVIGSLFIATRYAGLAAQAHAIASDPAGGEGHVGTITRRNFSIEIHVTRCGTGEIEFRKIWGDGKPCSPVVLAGEELEAFGRGVDLLASCETRPAITAY